jgi:hypothetical protein
MVNRTPAAPFGQTPETCSALQERPVSPLLARMASRADDWFEAAARRQFGALMQEPTGRGLHFSASAAFLPVATRPQGAWAAVCIPPSTRSVRGYRSRRCSPSGEVEWPRPIHRW